MSFRYEIPKGTEPAKCPRGCGVTVYWIERKRTWPSVGTVRMPIDTDCEDGQEPDSLSGGRGQNHLAVCEA